ncbi:GDSL esterase/lipase At4g16230-like [Syzygium oleosum]|uniref:GDSL esterase/lipase At4g16230-like n=1 Tax=Syzygium oleosum TaxID=219896 RepID=UPI0011D21920|nr:GDSL esterase/lipase At4g16230-like [Syzygium oleosum]
MAEASSPLLSSLSSHHNRNLLIFCAVSMMLVSALADDLPPVFMFGDSTFDVGTNNYIPSGATANFSYYGIDFPFSQATGRFSNGYNSADEIVKQLGYRQSPPPFLALLQDNSTFQSNLLQGVNFASGGAGILNTTGFQTWGEVISMEQQVQQFATVQGNITWLLGQNNSAKFFASSLFFISVGSNDIIDHYFYDEATVSQIELMAEIQSNYTAHLTALYNLGARKFGIVSVPPIGCCPFALLLNWTESGPGCLTELNDYAQAFYSTISALLQNLSSQLQGMIYSLGDAYTMTSILMDVPGVVGIVNIEAACCGGGRLNADVPCNITDSPNLCLNRNEYLFWDKFHPTQNAARKAAIALFTGTPTFVSPMNFSQLAQASA